MRAFNVFRHKSADGVFCAIPEDCAVPRFVTNKAWAFNGKLQEAAATPIGFNETAADSGVRFKGYYLFHGFAAR